MRRHSLSPSSSQTRCGNSQFCRTLYVWSVSDAETLGLCGERLQRCDEAIRLTQNDGHDGRETPAHRRKRGNAGRRDAGGQIISLTFY